MSVQTFTSSAGDGNSDATVTIGSVTADDNFGLFTSDGATDAIYTDYQVNNYYDYNPHIYMMGVTSPNGFGNSKTPSAFVQIAAPSLQMISDWTAARTAEQPKIPDPIQAPDWVLLDEQYQPAMLTIGADGVTPLYRISGTYVYGCLNPDFNSSSNMMFPIPPWLSGDSLDASVDDSDFVTNILKTI